MQQKVASGFTLIELLVVIAIIGLLASTVLASLVAVRENARDAQRLAEARAFMSALEIYRNQNNRYPCSGVSLSCVAGSAGGAAPITLKNNTGTYSAFGTTLRNTLTFAPSPDGVVSTALIYRARSSTGNNNDATDPTSYTILVRLERTADYCKINVGAGHTEYQTYADCPIRAI
ncbi:MAG: protein ral secretion pathway protein [Candidatus Parcubacteria bacterium]